MKFGTIDYVGEGSPLCTFGDNRITGASHHMGTFCCSTNSFLFFI